MFKQVKFRVVPEASSRIDELTTGNADITVNVPPDMAGRLEGSENARLATVQGARRIFIGFTVYNHPSLVETEVRQALNYAIDFDNTVASLLSGNGERTGTFVNPPWNNPDVNPYPYDPELALELMAEAGYTDQDGDGFVDNPDGSRLEYVISSPNGRYIKDLDIAQAVAADLKETGIYTEVKPMEWSTYVDQIVNRKVEGDMFLIGSGSGFEGQGDLADFMHDSAGNYGDWQDLEYEEVWSELAQTFDLETRRELIYQLQERMWQNPPLIYLYFQVDYYGVGSRVDWSPRSDELIDVYEVKWAD